MAHLHTVYEVDDFVVAVRYFLLLLIFPAFSFLGWCIYAYNKKPDDFEGKGDWFFGNKRARGIQIGFGLMVVGGIFSLLAFCLIISSYLKVIEQYHNQKYDRVEGRIRNLHIIPSKDSSLEAFDVDTLHFEYGSGRLSYSKISKDGGVIRNGLYVRISYIRGSDDKEIVKLETE